MLVSTKYSMLLNLVVLLISVSVIESLKCSAYFDCPRNDLSTGICDKEGVCDCDSGDKSVPTTPGHFGCALGIQKPQISLTEELKENNYDIIQGSNASFVCKTQELSPFTTKWLRDRVEISECTSTICTLTATTSNDVSNISCQVSKNGIFSVESDSISLTVIPTGCKYQVQPVAVQKYYAAMENSKIDMACGNIPIGSKYSWIDGFNKTVKMPVTLTKEVFFIPYACEVRDPRITFTNALSKLEFILDTYNRDGQIPDTLRSFKNATKAIKYPQNKNASLLNFMDRYYQNYTSQPHCDIGIFYRNIQVSHYNLFDLNKKLNLTCGCTSTAISSRIYPTYNHRNAFEHKTKAITQCEFISENGLERNWYEYTTPKDSNDKVIKYKLAWQDAKDAKEFQIVSTKWNKIPFELSTENKDPLYESDMTLSVTETSGFNNLAVYEWRKNNKLLPGFYLKKIYMNKLTDKDLGNYTVTIIPCPKMVLKGLQISDIQNCLKWASLFPELKVTKTYSINELNTIPATPKIVEQTMVSPYSDEEFSSTSTNSGIVKNRERKISDTEKNTESDAESEKGDYITLLCLTSSTTIRMTYQWMKDGSILQNNPKHALYIGPIQDKDKGKYTCTAEFNNHRSKPSEPYVISFNKTHRIFPKWSAILFLVCVCVLVTPLNL